MSIAYIRILRPVNCLMMGFAVSTGSIVSAGPAIAASSSAVLLGGSIIGFILTGSSMVLNDYADREIDSINEPTRPIPSGAVSPTAALLYGSSLAVLGIVAASLVGFTSLLVAVAAWLTFLTYTFFGKRTGFFGNLMVSFCVAIPFIYGGAILNIPIGPRILIFASIAFLANLGREVNKGIVDIEGDREKRVKTIAVRFGPRSAAVLSAMFYLAAATLSVLPLAWGMVTALYYIPVVLLTDAGLIFSSFSLLRNPSRANARTQKMLILFWMLLGLLAFLAGSIS